LKRFDGFVVRFADEDQGGHDAENVAVSQFRIRATLKMNRIDLFLELTGLYYVAEQGQSAVA